MARKLVLLSISLSVFLLSHACSAASERESLGFFRPSDALGRLRRDVDGGAQMNTRLGGGLGQVRGAHSADAALDVGRGGLRGSAGGASSFSLGSHPGLATASGVANNFGLGLGSNQQRHGPRFGAGLDADGEGRGSSLFNFGSGVQDGGRRRGLGDLFGGAGAGLWRQGDDGHVSGHVSANGAGADRGGFLSGWGSGRGSNSPFNFGQQDSIDMREGPGPERRRGGGGGGGGNNWLGLNAYPSFRQVAQGAGMTLAAGPGSRTDADRVHLAAGNLGGSGSGSASAALDLEARPSFLDQLRRRIASGTLGLENVAGDVQRGVGQLRDRLADFGGNLAQGGIDTALQGVRGMTGLARGALGLGSSLAGGLISGARGLGAQDVNLVQRARDAAKGAVDTVADVAATGVNIRNHVRDRVLDGVAGISDTASAIGSAGLSAADAMASGAGGMLSGMVKDAVGMAKSDAVGNLVGGALAAPLAGPLAAPLAAADAARQLLGGVSADASLNIRGPMGQVDLKYGREQG